MRLKTVQVKKYQNIVDSEVVEIQENITCLVGKNESGKTAFLESLHKMNPHDNSSFKPLEQYPRWKYKFDERRGLINSDPVVSCVFELESNEIEEVEEFFGKDSLISKDVTISKYYNNTWQFELELDRLAIYKERVLSLSEDSDLRKYTSQKKTLESFNDSVEEFINEGSDITSDEESALSFINENISVYNEKILSKYVPVIFYFSEYASLPGRIKLEQFLTKNLDQLNPSERTTNALLDLAGADRESIKSEEFENRIAELEASASAITQSVLEYWSQNKNISVDFKVDKETQTQPNGNQRIIAHYLDIRLRDSLHDITINFDRRSSGFKWFFSFLIAFSEFEFKDSPLIILLDEPGLNLHAKAQLDFLKFIEKRLAGDHQVIYTTHSPFMIDPKSLNQVRLVEDASTMSDKAGTRITSDIFSSDYDTIFPLQNALGYDLAQNLFIGKHNVIVEGTSDFVYLNTISRYLEEKGRSHFDFTKITITPVGSSSKVATFIALLGQHIEPVVFIDADKKESQRVSHLINKGILHKDKFLTPADFLDMEVADIEDLFDPEDYLKLYNDTFGKDIQLDELVGEDPLVRRITRKNGDFDHGKPADTLLRNTDTYLKDFSEETLNNFEEVIKQINVLIEEP